MARITIVDDNIEIQKLISAFLQSDGHETCCFSNGEAFLSTFDQFSVDLVVLDIMLPEIDGISVLQAIRSCSTVPVIMLTAKDSDGDYCLGLALGADDYVTKPFKAHLLTAKIRALLRRASMPPNNPNSQDTIVVGDLVCSPFHHRFSVVGKLLSLTPLEQRLLTYYMAHPYQPLSKSEILESVWQLCSDRNQTRALDEANRRLRNKLIEAGGNTYIRTVWGYGFELSNKAHEAHS